MRHWSTMESAQTPHAYARRTLLNHHLNRRRRRSREVVTMTLPEVDATPVESGSDTDDAWAWLATLPPRQRAVLVLRYYEDLPDADIASLLHITPGAVRTHASRGLAALRDQVPSRKARS
ncbi:MAG: sigma-70 family RNA polymerase sigma factor [Mobilicoccus sp.]|nr:sigma-70 family RNA polymerase sigma factor [Mobilicoccus sp.]